MEAPKLALTFTNGEKLTIEVSRFELNFTSDLLRGNKGTYKLGFFKINSSQYKQWPPISFISFDHGECSVLTETPPVKTPRTITYAIRTDWPD